MMARIDDNSKTMIERFCLSAIIIAAFLIRLIYWRCEPALSRDGTYYLLLARGEPVTDYLLDIPRQAPFFSSILRGMYLAGLDPHVCGILLNIMAGTGLVLIIGRISRHLSPSFCFISLCTALAAVHPALIRLSIELQRESIYMLFMGITILSAINVRESKEPRQFFLHISGTGAWGAFTALTRYEGWELMPLGYMWLTYRCCIQKAFPWRVLAGAIVRFTGAWLLIFVIITILIGYPIRNIFISLCNYLHIPCYF